MNLGFSYFDLVVRTVVPAAGLLVVIITLLLCKSDIDIQKNVQPPLTPGFNKDEMPGKVRITTKKPNVGPKGKSRQSAKPSRQMSRRVEPQAPMPPPKSTRVPGQQLPVIAAPTPGQTSRGIGGVPIQGTLMPPLKTQEVPVLTQQPQRKRILPAGKLKISQPVMRESTGRNILEKIAVTDLGTAARIQQERRQTGATITPSSAGLPSLSQKEMLQKLQVLPRKEVGSPGLNPRNSQVYASALQPSPGLQDMRRRSTNYSQLHSHPGPRTISQRASVIDSQRLPHISAVMTNFSLPSPAQPSSAPPVPAQNPRRRSLNGKTSPPRSSSGERVFTDPNRPPSIPRSLLQEARLDIPPKEFPPAGISSPLVPRVSPLSATWSEWNEQHRVSYMSPQDSSTYDQVAYSQQPYDFSNYIQPGFDAENNHRSIAPRSRSVKLNIRPSRQIPPSPPPASESTVVPKLPVQMLSESGIPGNPRALFSKGKFYTAWAPQPPTHFVIDRGIDMIPETATQKGSISTADVSSLKSSDSSMMSRPRPVPRKSRLYGSMSSTVSSNESRRRSHSTGQIDNLREILTAVLQNEANGESVPAPPRSADSAMFQMIANDSVTETAWEPVRAPQHVALASHTTTQSSNPSRNTPKVSDVSTESHENSYNSADASKVIPRMPVQSNSSFESVKRRSSNTLAIEELRVLSMMDDTSNTSPFAIESLQGVMSSGRSSAKSLSWHRRIGDPCPTFSDRKSDDASPRKVVPPRPLRLSTYHNSVIIETEPSPLESPSQTLDIIQQQLDNLDDGESESGDKQERRMTLLENLESEMKTHKSKWLQMKNELAHRSSADRSSTSSLSVTSRHNSSKPSPKSRPKTSEGVLEYSQTQNLSDNDSSHNSIPSTVNSSDASENQLDRKITLHCPGSAVSVTSTMSHQTNPTPPDTDESGSEYDEDDDAGVEFTILRPIGPGSSHVITIPPSASPNTAGATPRSAVRGNSLSKEESDALVAELAESMKDSWTPGIPSVVVVSPGQVSNTTIQPESSTGSILSPPGDLPARPLTATFPPRPKLVKPPRRSRRMTQLADIVESPEPLENKRGTLGIFKFPSGETSDSAIFSPSDFEGQYKNESGIPLAHPLTTGEDQPISFFDSDNEENAGDNFSQSPDDEDYSDDDFDDSTLWEIANLLRSDSVPSRHSLLPPADDDDAESLPQLQDFDDPALIASPTSPLIARSAAPATPAATDLWAERPPTPEPEGEQAIVHPTEEQWAEYLLSPSTNLYAPRNIDAGDVSIVSQALWAMPAEIMIPSLDTALWGAPLVSEPKNLQETLWAPVVVQTKQIHGTVQEEALWESALAKSSTLSVPSRSRRTAEPQTIKLESNCLWSAPLSSIISTDGLWVDQSKPTKPVLRPASKRACQLSPISLPSPTDPRFQRQRPLTPELFLPQLAGSSLWSTTAGKESSRDRHWLASPIL